MDETLCTAFYKRYKRMEKVAAEQLEKLSNTSDGFNSQCSSDVNFITQYNNPSSEQPDRVRSPFVNNVKISL
jgi:hypothetical protein